MEKCKNCNCDCHCSKKEHKDLIILVSDFFKDYKAIKTHLFRMIKKIMKSEKLRLIDRH